ncbi:hypothetical protein D3C87_1854820 [compost metagenome]
MPRSLDHNQVAAFDIAVCVDVVGGVSTDDPHAIDNSGLIHGVASCAPSVLANLAVLRHRQNKLRDILDVLVEIIVSSKEPAGLDASSECRLRPELSFDRRAGQDHLARTDFLGAVAFCEPRDCCV